MTEPTLNVSQNDVLALVGELTLENRILKTQLALAKQKIIELTPKEEPKNDEAHPT